MTKEIYQMNDTELAQHLEEREREVEAIREVKRQRDSMTDEQELAEEMHRRLCRMGHSNPGYDCDWPYEDWTGFTHRRYLEGAREFLGQTGNLTSAMKLVNTFANI